MEEKKYIRLFQTHSEYEEFVNSDEYITPCVSLCKDTHKLHYNPYVEEVKPIVLNYFTLVNTSEEPLSIQLNGQTLNYKLSNSNDWLTSTALTVNVGEEIQLKGNYTPNAAYGIGTFSVSGGTFDVKGNIMSLLYGDDFEGQTNLTNKNYSFKNLFTDCTTLVNANELILPATTLAYRCYSYMFQGCTSLTSSPSLPATTLAENCYSYMFQGCTSLVTAPALPATTLASYCYYNMFYNCTSLTTAPELPAIKLASGCYESMFAKCTNLVTAPELLATTLAYRCYANMFQGCTSLTTASELLATTLAEKCYYFMFRSCTSLTSAPVLLATTLTTDCYQYMFYGCSNLSNITMLATDISASNCLSSWVDGVASEGTFTKHKDMQDLTIGTSGIPNGWTVVDYENIIPFTIVNTSESSLSIQLKQRTTAQTLTYKLSSSEDWVTSTLVTVGVGEEVQLKGVYTPNGSYGIGTFSVNGGTFDVKGNVMSLLYADDFEGQLDLSGKDYVFSLLFSSCTNLVNANELILPATTLAKGCYQSMFRGCSSLINALELPATTLASYCYDSMFQGCTSLTSAPELPATILAEKCYYSMFAACSSLTESPQLLATTLADECYAYMFEGCTSLNSITMLATDISASDCLIMWCDGVASEGTFTKHLQMTSLPNDIDGIPEGWTVKDYVEPSLDLITFTIENETYNAIQGMTWGEWVNSEYNTIGITINEYNSCVEYDIYNVATQDTLFIQYASDFIIENQNYIYYIVMGGGSN